MMDLVAIGGQCTGFFIWPIVEFQNISFVTGTIQWRFLAAIAALYALMSVGLSVCPSVPPQRVSRSVPKLLNIKNGSGEFIGVLYSQT